MSREKYTPLQSITSTGVSPTEQHHRMLNRIADDAFAKSAQRNTPQVQEVVPMYRPNEALGKHDVLYVHPDNIRKAEELGYHDRRRTE